jgi:DHA2 family multidrug resistance protein
MDSKPIIVSGFIQGFGTGLIFVPLSTLAFATIIPSVRPEASAVYTLIRSLGSSVGISIMQALFVSNTQTVHESLSAHFDPANTVARATLPAGMNPATADGLAQLNGEVTRQASMIAYIDDFRLMLIITLACLPMLLLLRVRKGPLPPELMHVE